MSMGRILATVTMDTEADHNTKWQRVEPLTFRSVTQAIPEILDPLFKKYGVRPVYFLSAEVLRDEPSVETLKKIKDLELGTHLHGECIEPEADSIAPGHFAHSSYTDDVEFAKLNNLTNLFEKAFGKRPVSYRGGRFGADHETIRSLNRLGYLVDSSVTPHISWKWQQGPDFSLAPEQPYFVSGSDICQPGAGPILEIPITIGKKRIPLLPDRWYLYRWLRPTVMTVWEMKQVIKEYVTRYYIREHIVLNMMFHSMEFVLGATSYCRTQRQVQSLVRRLDGILKYMVGLEVTFLTTEEIYHVLKNA